MRIFLTALVLAGPLLVAAPDASGACRGRVLVVEDAVRVVRQPGGVTACLQGSKRARALGKEAAGVSVEGDYVTYSVPAAGGNRDYREMDIRTGESRKLAVAGFRSSFRLVGLLADGTVAYETTAIAGAPVASFEVWPFSATAPTKVAETTPNDPAVVARAVALDGSAYALRSDGGVESVVGSGRGNPGHAAPGRFRNTAEPCAANVVLLQRVRVVRRPGGRFAACRSATSKPKTLGRASGFEASGEQLVHRRGSRLVRLDLATSESVTLADSTARTTVVGLLEDGTTAWSEDDGELWLARPGATAELVDACDAPPCPVSGTYALGEDGTAFWRLEDGTVRTLPAPGAG